MLEVRRILKRDNSDFFCLSLFIVPFFAFKILYVDFDHVSYLSF